MKAEPVRYWALVSDELMESDPQWPAGFRPVEPANLPPEPSGDARWWLFEDNGAPASLAGKCVEVAFVRSGDGVMIGSRSPAT